METVARRKWGFPTLPSLSRILPMTDYSELLKADNNQPAHMIQIVDAESFESWLSAQPQRVRAIVAAQKFAGKGYEHAIIPGDDPSDWSVVAGVANRSKLSSWCLAKLAEILPEGQYRLAEGLAGPAMLGWLTAQYRFDRYRRDENATGPRVLLTGEVAQIDVAVRLAEAVALVRDLVNIPAGDMGPAQLEEEAAKVADSFSARFTVTKGDPLEQGFPMIHAVGRAAGKDFAPRLIELRWGDPKHPRVAIVGKGICFDSGGLDIKPSSAMRLMKKDMGGAAHALALAQLIMGARLPVQLHVLIPAAENAVGGNAFRPGDI